MKNRYTFDVIHRDSFPRQFQVRFANQNDDEGDVFDSLKGCLKVLDKSMSFDVFISLEVMRDFVKL